MHVYRLCSATWSWSALETFDRAKSIGPAGHRWDAEGAGEGGGGAGEGDPWGGRDLRNETRERVGPERVNEFLWRKCLLVVLTFFFFHGRALISNSHLLRRAGKKREEEKTKQQNEKLATAAPCGFGFSSELLVLYSLETSWKLSPCH